MLESFHFIDNLFSLEQKSISGVDLILMSKVLLAASPSVDLENALDTLSLSNTNFLQNAPHITRRATLDFCLWAGLSRWFH